MPARLPRVPVQPGDHAVEWFVSNEVIPGELSLMAGQPPKAVLYGDVVPRDWSQGGGFPEDHEQERLAGRLRSNLDVVLTDGGISIWFPQRSFGSARHAVVGLNVAAVPDDAYHRVRFQLTDLDLLFGVAPIQSVSWPGERQARLEGAYSIETNPAAHQVWVDESSGVTVECTYDLQFPLSGGHQHYVAFAPVVSIASDVPLTVDGWIEGWVMPLLRLAALATRKPQKLSWLTVNTAPRQAAEDVRMRSTTGTVFGHGIEQAPYEAEYREEWRESGHRPLFSLASIPMSLTELVENWRRLETDQNPFIELFGLTLRQTDLPARARYLYLIQALEALHSFENRAKDERAQAAFAQKRGDALTTLTENDVPRATLRFIKNNWSQRRADSLDRRLKALIEQVPDEVRAVVSLPPAGEVLTHMTETGMLPMQNLLRQLRNDLSHGNRNYSDRDLRPWVRIVETLCRAHALRLLKFNEDAIVAGLAPPPSPALPRVDEGPPPT